MLKIKINTELVSKRVVQYCISPVLFEQFTLPTTQPTNATSLKHALLVSSCCFSWLCVSDQGHQTHVDMIVSSRAVMMIFLLNYSGNFTRNVCLLITEFQEVFTYARHRHRIHKYQPPVSGLSTSSPNNVFEEHKF